MAALAFVLALAFAAGSATLPATGAGANVTVSLEVPTHTEVGGCAPGPAIDFGIVLPGTVHAPAADCTITFGSSNASSTLRIAQADGVGAAMFRMTDGELDQDFDGGVGGNGQFTVSGATPLDWDQTRPVVAMQPTTGKMVVAWKRTSDAINVIRLEPDGTLDPTFGTAGRYSNGTWPYGSVNAMAIAPDGSIHIVTRSYWSPYPTLLLKLTPDGALDTSYDGPDGDGDGIVVHPGIEAFNPGAAIVSDDGGLLVAGTWFSGGLYRGVVLKFDPTGAYDASYGGGDGRVEVFLGNHTYLRAAALQPDGKLVAVGNEWAGDRDFTMARITSDGVLDPTFDGPSIGGGSNGLFWVPGPAGEHETAESVAIAADGDIIVAGGSNVGGGEIYIMRFDGATGDLDPDWDGPSGSGDGRVRISLGSGGDWASEVLVAPTGQIYVAGVTTLPGMGSEPLLLRLNDDGTLDETFDGDSGTANGAVRVTATAGDDEVTHAAFGPDGDILLAGTTDGATDLLRLTQFAGSSLADYDDDDAAPADQAWSEGSGFFGVCLRSFSGTAASVVWTTDASCTQSDAGTHWRGVPRGGAAATVGSLGAPATDGVANLRFAARLPLDQAPGSYVAPLHVEVLAP